MTSIVKKLIEDLGQSFRAEVSTLFTEVANLCSFVEGELDELRREVSDMRGQCQALHKASSPTSTSYTSAAQGAFGLKVPKPDTFSGARKATVVDNFLFGLKRYFDALGVNDDVARINNALIYLRDAAQLWWRRKHAEREKEQCSIWMWDQFKAELRKHFVSHNAGEKAKGTLRRLRQTGGVLDYVKEFTTLTLEVDSLPDNDALFYFKDGLKDWAQVELNWRTIQTLDDAIAAAEGLVDYSTQKEKKPGPNKSGGDRSTQRKEQGRNDGHKGKPSHDKRGKGTKGESSNPPKPCFICNGPHWTRECPNRKAMNALVAKFREANKAAEELEAKVGSIQQINALADLFSP